MNTNKFNSKKTEKKSNQQDFFNVFGGFLKNDEPSKKFVCRKSCKKVKHANRRPEYYDELDYGFEMA